MKTNSQVRQERRASLLAKSQDIIDTAKAANRDLTNAEITTIEATHAEVKELDAQIAQAAKGKELHDALAGLVGGYLALDPESTFMNGDGLAKAMLAGMTKASARAGRAKGLISAGEVVTDLPVVNATPIAAAGEHELKPPRLLDTLPLVQRPAHYSYLRQTVIVTPGEADVVAAGGLKPTKRLGLERVDDRLRVVAVLSEPIDKYLLDDAPNLRAWVGTELAASVQTALETQVLTGDGTGENFTGLANVSGVQTEAFATDIVTTVRKGLSDLEVFGIAPRYIALAPTDWVTAQTTRNTSGAFDVGGPIDPLTQRLWGVKVVIVPGLSAGTGWIVGDEALYLSTDGKVAVEWGTPGDAFTRNQVVARVEGRFNLDVAKPHALVQLAFV